MARTLLDEVHGDEGDINTNPCSAEPLRRVDRRTAAAERVKDDRPSAASAHAAAEDPVAHALDLQRQRCVLFVACTRPRDRLYLSYTGAPSPFLR